jgi:tRNA(fMet)-specific endonuclease VapC
VTGRYLLDTDTVVDVLRGRYGVADRLAGVSPDDVRMSAMSVAELYCGALNSSDPTRNRAEVDRLLNEIPILQFGRAAAAHHASIRLALRHQPIGAGDMIVAATALAADAVVITANVREFGRVPGLVTENWRAMLR